MWTYVSSTCGLAFRSSLTVASWPASAARCIGVLHRSSRFFRTSRFQLINAATVLIDTTNWEESWMQYYMSFSICVSISDMHTRLPCERDSHSIKILFLLGSYRMHLCITLQNCSWNNHFVSARKMCCTYYFMHWIGLEWNKIDILKIVFDVHNFQVAKIEARLY